MVIDSGKERKIGVILSYSQMAINIIIGLIYTPVMIRMLGQNEYGLYNIVASTISMLSILKLGFNTGYIKYYSEYKKSNDYEQIWKLNGLFLKIFLFLGTIALLCGVYLVNNLSILFGTGLTLSEYRIVRVLMSLLCVNLAISFPSTVLTTIISANEKFVVLKLVSIISTVVGPLVTLPLLMHGFRSIAMVSVSVTVSIITDIIYLVFVVFVLKQKFNIIETDKSIVKGLFVYTGLIAVNTVVDQINWNIDKILLSRFIGSAEVAIYSVGFTFYNYYMLFSTSISGVFAPRIHSLVTHAKSKEQLRENVTGLFIRVGRIQFIILGLIASGFIFFGKYFIVNYWADITYERSYYVALLLMLPASIMLIQNMGIEIQRAQRLHHFRSIAYSIMAAINLGISIILCQKYGALGCAAGTAFSLIFANGLVMNIYYHKKCNIDIIQFWKEILQFSRGIVIPIACGAILALILRSTSSMILFLLIISVYTVIYSVSIYKFSMNDYEKSLVNSIYRRLRHLSLKH